MCDHSVLLVHLKVGLEDNVHDSHVRPFCSNLEWLVRLKVGLEDNVHDSHVRPFGSNLWNSPLLQSPGSSMYDLRFETS